MNKKEYLSPEVEISEITVQCGMLVGSGEFEGGPEHGWMPED